MNTERVAFYSEGVELSGLLRGPDRASDPMRAIVQGPGWLGLKDASMYEPYHEALAAAGFATLIFDYRGFGDSGGERGWLSPTQQLTDLMNAVTYLTSRDDVDGDNIGAFGSGGTGGGNVFLLAQADPRVRAIVSQVPVSDGEDWLHRMRAEHEWLSYLDELRLDRIQRVTTGGGRKVDPREGIMVATPERKQTAVKRDVDGRVPSEVPLACVDEILRYRPIDAARQLDVPAMVVAVEGDATTPTDHATDLFHALSGPKKLVMQRHTTHYAAYKEYGAQIAPMIVAWFDQHLQRGGLDVLTE
jgi:uncharacterized protein